MSTQRTNIPLPALPLIPILRGLTPAEAEPVGKALFAAGFTMLEVPLNRPGALECIAILRRTLPSAIVGAGTVLSVEHVEAVALAGGQLIVSPDCNPDVIKASVAMGLWSLPGVATPSEAFSALRAGAHGLKAFPAEAIPPAALKAWRAVLPAEVALFPVGGITPDRLAIYHDAGANGFGIGGALYAPGLSLDIIAARAKEFAAAWRALSR
ncbi:2-dehydro-3-deoxy-6-phosphogalactonate aldolase [Uliginosibacterium sp. H3]|uniref:2-dehydro-3-deoxy-6-phosphogalactonate aldolase n=1 Tax=Uliginosibacterium silvisoli TaxID=3114758 RepID=A0ABU6K5M5_9RHOO|nr:2-dehydro-3-deoxy-6-phosphogalactonate aldolase [Uliginosibacterium sp. H3]